MSVKDKKMGSWGMFRIGKQVCICFLPAQLYICARGKTFHCSSSTPSSTALMTRVFPIPPSPATVRSIWSMVELQLEVNALGMIGHMAIDDRETVWTTLAVEVVMHQICFHLGIHWLTYFRRCIETTCAPDFRDNRKLLSRKNRIFSWKDIYYLGNDVARTGKMGSFEPFSEI